MTVIDKATRRTHVIPCSKTITAAETARLYWRYVAKLHGIPRCIYTDRGTQFTSRLWRELWEIMGTQLRFSTTYHPQTQGVVERMNTFIGQMQRCIIHELNECREWDSLLPKIELAINSLPNRNTGYSDMKSNVVMVAIVLIWDFIFMFLCLDMVLYILGYFTFYMSH